MAKQRDITRRAVLQGGAAALIVGPLACKKDEADSATRNPDSNTAGGTGGEQNLPGQGGRGQGGQGQGGQGRADMGAGGAPGGNGGNTQSGSGGNPGGVDANRIDSASGAGDAKPATAPDAGATVSGIIIDTHTHFWDTARPNPPGRASAVPFSDPKRPILPPEYATKAAAAGIKGTVIVEASGWLEDNDWLLDQAKNNPIIVGIMGNLGEVMGKPAFKTTLDRLAMNPLYRGVRLGSAGDLARPDRKDDLLALAEKGLVVDINANGAAAVKTTAAGAKGIPGLKVILDHAAYIKFDAAPTADWISAFEAAAESPNVYCKVSRFQEQAVVAGKSATDPEAYKAVFEMLWKTFGENRLIFGTNWPILENVGSLVDSVKIARSFFDSKGRAAADKFFAGNAKTVYGWVQR